MIIKQVIIVGDKARDSCTDIVQQIIQIIKVKYVIKVGSKLTCSIAPGR